MNQIIFKIDAQGNVSYDMAGFKGEACFEAARKVLDELARLGVTTEITQVERKPDAEEQVGTGQRTEA
jgi:hypothetical protein